MRGSSARLASQAYTIASVIGMLACATPCELQAQTSSTREVEAAYDAAWSASVRGPKSIGLLDQGTLKLPASYAFVPMTEGTRLMHAMGNSAGSRFLGLVLPQGGGTKWFMTVEYDAIGFAQPAIMSALAESDIYDHLKLGTAKGNATRIKHGAGRLDLAGFIDKPKYNAANHRLTLATRVTQLGPSDAYEDSVNLDAYLFGREGAFMLTLVASESEYQDLRVHMDAVHAGLAFAAGKQAADAVSGTDPVVQHPLEMIFGGQTVDDMKALAAEAAAQKAADQRSRAAAIVDAERKRGWTLWLTIALGVMAVAIAIGAIAMGGGGTREPPAPKPERTTAVERALRASRPASPAA
jgi:uncharacterized membrane-anchored protein